MPFIFYIFFGTVMHYIIIFALFYFDCYEPVFVKRTSSDINRPWYI